MDTFDQDPILELMAFLRSQEGLSSKLAQEMINSFLLQHFILLSVFALLFIFGIGIIKAASHRSGAMAFEIDRQRGLGNLICFISFLLAIYPLYSLAEGFLFPRVVVLREMARMFE
jgi:hypothetical protein